MPVNWSCAGGLDATFFLVTTCTIPASDSNRRPSRCWWKRCDIGVNDRYTGCLLSASCARPMSGRKGRSAACVSQIGLLDLTSRSPSLDFRCLGERERILNMNAEVFHDALDCRMAEQDLHGS